jgi:hypothetical protein
VLDRLNSFPGGAAGRQTRSWINSCLPPEQKSPAYAYHFGVQLSEQERQRRSELAKRLHREGRLGGPGPARRSVEVRARKASELSAAIVEKHRAKIERAIVAGLDSASVAQQLKAAELALKMGLRSEAIDVGEAKVEGEQRSREELIAALLTKLDGPGGAVMARALAERHGIVEAQAADVLTLPARSVS